MSHGTRETWARNEHCTVPSLKQLDHIESKNVPPHPLPHTSADPPISGNTIRPTRSPLCDSVYMIPLTAQVDHHPTALALPQRTMETNASARKGQNPRVQSSGCSAGHLSKAAQVIGGSCNRYHAQPKPQDEQTLIHAIQGYLKYTLPVIREILDMTSQHGLVALYGAETALR